MHPNPPSMESPGGARWPKKTVLKGSADFSAKGSRVIRFAFLFRFFARASKWGGERAGTKISLASAKNNGQEKKHPLSRRAIRDGKSKYMALQPFRYAFG
jgi:hypothetical protein